MPAVLVEYGFMDSKVDAPIIITDAYSKMVAYATMEGIAKVEGLKRVGEVKDPETEAELEKYEICRIRESWNNAASQVGAFYDLERAKAVCPPGYSVFGEDGRVLYSNPTKENVPDPVDALDFAKTFTKDLAGTYRVNSVIGLKLRTGASTLKKIIETMPNGSKFTCYGYHTGSWLFGVSASGKQGFCHKSMLKK